MRSSDGYDYDSAITTTESDALAAHEAMRAAHLPDCERSKAAATERIIPGTFSKVSGGYEQKVDERITIFVPDMCAASFIPETGELHGYVPDYEAIEAAKTPAVHADKPGEYVYCYEMQQAPTGCDFAADLAYYGKHYFLHPLRDDLPRLHGRGITYDEHDDSYMVTIRAYEKLKKEYRIKRETCLD